MSAGDDRPGGITVTAPTATDPTAVVGRRIVAYLVDIVLTWGVQIGVVFATGNVTEIVDADTCDELTRIGDRACFYGADRVFLVDNRGVTLGALAAFAFVLLFQVIVTGVAGWSPGKLVLGIRVVDETGGGPGIGRALIRWILLLVDWFPYCLPLVGLITVFTTKGHRRVGDMLAKTYVVRARDRGRPVAVPGAGGAAAGATPPPAPAMPTAPPMAASPPMPASPPVQPPPPPGQAVTPPMGVTVAPPPPPPTEPQPVEPAPSPAPGGSPTAPAGEPGGAAPADPGDPTPAEPRWDAERGAYVAWDAAQGIWLAYDQAAGEWRPLT
jgi:uncharacterized RDD family membrane protein YckC